MAVLGRFNQQPGETMDYYLDYTKWFSTREDNPLSAQVFAATGVTLAGFALDQQRKTVRVVLRQPTDGLTSKITVRLTTDSGVIKEDDFVVKGKEV